MKNVAPGFIDHPNHSVEISSADCVIAVSIDGVEIGKTDSALALIEANYPLAYYLPLETLKADSLQPSDHTSYCPFKGTASYYNLAHNGKTFENAIWTYKDPYDEAIKIKDHIAIYPNVAEVGPA